MRELRRLERTFGNNSRISRLEEDHPIAETAVYRPSYPKMREPLFSEGIGVIEWLCNQRGELFFGSEGKTI
jgi:hypothetical protein